MSTAIESGKCLSERILDCFPSGSYALHALLSLIDIVETDTIATAAVECRAEPRLLVNPEFVDRSADTPEKLLMLVMHELHHILLGHTRLFPCVTAVDNLVFDAVINSLLCRMFPAPEHSSFFTGFYDEEKFPACLLRPPDGWNPRSTAILLPKGLTRDGLCNRPPGRQFPPSGALGRLPVVASPGAAPRRKARAPARTGRKADRGI